MVHGVDVFAMLDMFGAFTLASTGLCHSQICSASLSLSLARAHASTHDLVAV